jgi:DNA-binding NarL/FixJ family response regulator
MADQPEKTAAPKSIDQIQEQTENHAQTLRDPGATAEEKSEARRQLNDLSKQAGELRRSQIENDKNLDDDEKRILKLYESGMQNYAIAKEVYKFVNQDTVGKVILTIRKAYADDWNEVEDVNSTKGYTGV